MAAAMVKATDALWDGRGVHDPTVAAASTQHSRSPALNSGKKGDKRSSKSRSKSRPPSRPDFYSFQNLGNGSVNFTLIMPIRLTGVLRPVLGGKTSLC